MFYYAKHLSCAWILPQRSHDSSFELFSLANLWRVCCRCSIKSFCCILVESEARTATMASSKLKSVFRRRRSLIVSESIPQTAGSRIGLSSQVPNSYVFGLLWRSITNISNGQPFCLQVMKIYRSYIIFFFIEQ